MNTKTQSLQFLLINLFVGITTLVSGLDLAHAFSGVSPFTRIQSRLSGTDPLRAFFPEQCPLFNNGKELEDNVCKQLVPYWPNEESDIQERNQLFDRLHYHCRRSYGDIDECDKIVFEHVGLWKNLVNEMIAWNKTHKPTLTGTLSAQVKHLPCSSNPNDVQEFCGLTIDGFPIVASYPKDGSIQKQTLSSHFSLAKITAPEPLFMDWKNHEAERADLICQNLGHSQAYSFETKPLIPEGALDRVERVSSLDKEFYGSFGEKIRFTSKQVSVAPQIIGVSPPLFEHFNDDTQTASNVPGPFWVSDLPGFGRRVQEARLQYAYPTIFTEVYCSNDRLPPMERRLFYRDDQAGLVREISVNVGKTLKRHGEDFPLITTTATMISSYDIFRKLPEKVTCVQIADFPIQRGETFNRQTPLIELKDVSERCTCDCCSP